MGGFGDKPGNYGGLSASVLGSLCQTHARMAADKRPWSFHHPSSLGRCGIQLLHLPCPSLEASYRGILEQLPSFEVSPEKRRKMEGSLKSLKVAD